MSLPGYEDVPSLTEAIYALRHVFVARLQKYHPRQSPVKADAIAQSLNIRRSQVSALRRACWKLGYPVGTCYEGFYWARSAADWEDTVNHIEARAKSEQTNVYLVNQIGARFQNSSDNKTQYDLLESANANHNAIQGS